MKLSILMFDGVTALDAIGGYEILARIPGMDTEFFAERPAVVAADTRRLGLAAWRGFDEVDRTDILYVPGGPGAFTLETNKACLAKLRALDATSTITVGICNGVGLLAAAGLLAGQSATTNFFYRERLAAHGVEVVNARYHRSGKYVTGAGVSASIDTALFLAAELAGEDMAKTLQLGIEYYPAPPFPESRPEDAPAGARDLVARIEQTEGRRQLEQRAPFEGMFKATPREALENVPGE